MKNRKNYLKFRKNQFKWKLIGWHFPEAVCENCGQKTIYHIYRYDAKCCVSCNEWLEEACSDPDCPFCSGRPKTPYEAWYLADIEAGSAGMRKRWRCDNYQHKADGMRRHKRRREAVEESSGNICRCAK